jgi:ABC-2 type transport system ATP-binding protein
MLRARFRSDPVIETFELEKHYGGTAALRGLSFAARPGEILGFLGPNGAGKSTTVKILTGMIKPTRGRALVAGIDVVAAPMEAKRRIGYVPESAALYETLSGREYLALVAALHQVDAASASARAAELFDVFDLSDAADQRISDYSKGMKQKVLLAAALLHRPDVLLLDEPLNGLDANSVHLVKEVLRGLAAQGKTILFCSHLLDIVERMCTRILVIAAGQRVAEGTSAEIVAAAQVETLDRAFERLTGGASAERAAADLLAALERH